MLKHRGLLAIHGTGTGKTLTAVASINCILKNFPTMNIIIITPTSLISNFKKEMLKFGLVFDSIRLRQKIKFYSFKEFVINIHTSEKDFKICKDNFIIIDEAHNLRNLSKREKLAPGESAKGITAATILQCIKSASKILLLTATPILNRISDIDSLIAMIDGTDIQPLPKNYSLEDIENKFKCKISINPGNKLGDEFPSRIDIPNEETTFIMSNNYYTRYLDVQNEKGAEFLNLFHNNIFFNAVRRAALSLDDVNSPKVQWTFNKIKEEHEQNRKSVVYTAWKESGVNVVTKLLDLHKIPYRKYTGDMSKKQRDEARDAYNNYNNKKKPLVNILIITRAGGEGLDLKGTNNVILMEPNWNRETDEQIIGRGIRRFSHSHLPPNLRYTKVYKLYMYKPRNKYEGDNLESVDEILYKTSYEVKDPIIKSFLNLIEKFSIENIDCEKCCIVKKVTNAPSINDKEFFDYYKLNKKIKSKSGSKSQISSREIERINKQLRTEKQVNKSKTDLVKTICGNILNSKETFILQQCNCTGNTLGGLAKSINDKFSINPYIRKQNDIPGTFSIMENYGKKVVCLFAQRYPGKPNETDDTEEQRLQWFRFSLDKFMKTVKGTLAMPYNIGCGLAGGDWNEYSSVIKSLSEKHGKEVTLYNNNC